MKRGLEVYDPLQVAALRVSISFAALLPLALSRIRFVAARDWPHFVVVGWAGSAIPAFLFALAQTRIDSAVAGMINSLTPLFTLLVGMLFFQLRFKSHWLLGIVTGLIGVLLIIGRLNDWTFGPTGWYALAALIATFFYALSGNTVKARLAHLDTYTISSLGFFTAGPPAFLVLLGSGFVSRTQAVSGAWEAIGYIALLALLGTVLASVVFYYLIKLTDQIFGSMVSYLIPLVALGWGVLDGEVLHLSYFIGLLFILSGVHLARSK
jgi:drug/metabolite transporter (DMT)-like permease